MTAVDIISQYPPFAEVLLSQLQPTEIGVIPQHPLDRYLDTYFLNTAEHFTAVIDTKIAKDLLASAASPYLGTSDERNSLEAFEAAHSVMLAVMAAPHNIDLAASHLETYTERLFERPLLPSILLEIMRFRVESASSQPLASLEKNGKDDTQPMSEQAALVLTLIHSLPCLHLEALEDWLPVTARLCHLVQDPALRHVCNHRLWDVMSNGEMDLDRAALCVNWWNTERGREMVLYGEEKARSGDLINKPVEEASRP
ncbi:MAG: hypothetical protein Q9221_000280 [Calogaya cf. arnoldii]